MRKLLVTLDDELDTLLAGMPNQGGMMRECTKLYMGHILPETANGLRASYMIVGKRLEAVNDKIDELDSKLDYIARKLQ